MPCSKLAKSSIPFHSVVLSRLFTLSKLVKRERVQFSEFFRSFDLEDIQIGDERINMREIMKVIHYLVVNIIRKVIEGCSGGFQPFCLLRE
jgi:hypothetical protein